MTNTLKGRLEARATEAIEARGFPGCVIGVVYASGERLVLPFGKQTYEENGVPVKEDTVYDLASITKSIPTASLAIHFIEKKQLKLTDKLIKYVPEFNNSDRKLVKIKSAAN